MMVEPEALKRLFYGMEVRGQNQGKIILP